MYAIEFQTIIKNGVIEIPKQYQGRLQHRVRVILLGDEVIEAELERRAIIDVLAESPGQQVFQTAESVEQYLQEERASWER